MSLILMSCNIYPLTYRNPLRLLIAQAACFHRSLPPGVKPGSCVQSKPGVSREVWRCSLCHQLLQIETTCTLPPSFLSPCCLLPLTKMLNKIPHSAKWLMRGWRDRLGWLESSYSLSVCLGFFLYKMRRMNWSVFLTLKKNYRFINIITESQE